MLAKMVFSLKADGLSELSGSSFHGFLMEQLTYQDAEYFHQDGFKPYSQAIYKKEDNYFWQVNTLNKEAFAIINQALFELEYIHIKNKNSKYQIIKKQVETIGLDEFSKYYLTLGSPNRYINIAFETPCSFKSSGVYTHIPDVRLLIQSLLNKFEHTNTDFEFKSQDLLEEIQTRVTIDSYNLRSRKFHLEGITIPAFQGRLSLNVRGPDNLKNLLHLLVAFGQYSGLGIKTALGMGKIKKTGSEQWIKKNSI